MANEPLGLDSRAAELSNEMVSKARSTLNLKNELATSSSPYLRSHKDNLVAWQEWSPKTIALAKTHERPIFLSIGYTACHWCHVMAHESFDSPDIANMLNDSFVSIKVDRESRPDLDDIYMNYVTATTGSGGWPLNVFLTPDLQPLFGGTYWPSPGSETTLPKSGETTEERPLNFLDIVQKIRDIWQNERQRCLASAADITHQLQAFSAEGIHAHSSVHVRGVDDENEPPEPLDLDLLDDALDHFVTRYDSKHGGFTTGTGLNGPKFPTPANLTFLLRIGASITRPSTHTRFGFPNPIPGIIGKKSCATAASMALHTLQSMSRSALRDHLGNGFHRYSVTPDWNLPHFEKMLYDNAQLLGVYCDAWALARDPEILGAIYDLVEYLTSSNSPIVRKNGGWYASEAADSRPSLAAAGQEKKEGAFYVWTVKELQSVLGDRDSNIVARHFGIKEHGNIAREHDVSDEFINQNVLHINATPSILAKEFGLKEDEIVRVIKEGKRKLVEYRKSQRAIPEVDDKIVLSWNALAISALARASVTLASFDESKAQASREAAENAVTFIMTNMFDKASGRLTRIYSDHTSTSESHGGIAFVDDYAYMVQALRTLFDLTFEQSYLDWALQLQSTLDRDFGAGRNGGYFQSPNSSHRSETGIVSPNSGLGGLAQAFMATKDQATTMPDQILNLKPGTDSALPSPNGVIASNLLYLSSYAAALGTSTEQSSDTSTVSELPAPITEPLPTPETATTTKTTTDPPSTKPQSSSVLLKTARTTIDAFAPEIIQHPFLYVSLLSAVVLSTVGIRTLLLPSTPTISNLDIESRGLRGFGRTLIRSSHLKEGEVLVCEIRPERLSGDACRPLKDGELDGWDDAFVEEDDEENAVPEVSSEVIERRDEMARRESLALLVHERSGLDLGGASASASTSTSREPVVTDSAPPSST